MPTRAQAVTIARARAPEVPITCWPEVPTSSTARHHRQGEGYPPTMETSASRPWKRASPDRGKPKILTIPSVHRTPDRNNPRRKPHKII